MSIHIHLGAHKTASTHLQAVLRRNRGGLAEAGIAYLGPDAIRALSARGARAAAKMGVWPSLRALAARRRLGRALQGGRIIASDENALGGCAEMMRAGRLYPHARARLRVWSGVKPGARLYLCIREYGPFLSGAYVQSLVGGRAGRAVDAARLAALPRRWPDVVADIAAALPGRRLTVWDYADYAALGPVVLGAMTGDVPLEPVSRRPMATPSARAVEIVLDMVQGGRATRADLEAAAHDHPIGPDQPKFSLFDAETSARLALQFREDLDAIAVRANVDLLRLEGV